MENKERALAHIEKIEWVKPIEGANNIELIGVLGWVCVAKKGEFQTGDLAVYIEIDSKCPENDERFEFLANKKYKVKTMKLGKFKVISQGLALPLSLFPELDGKNIGDDVSKDLKIPAGICCVSPMNSGRSPPMSISTPTIVRRRKS